MYRITFVRLGTFYKRNYPYGYLGRNPNRGFFTKEFNTIEEAVKFTMELPINVYIRELENFSKTEKIVFNKKRLSCWRKQSKF